MTLRIDAVFAFVAGITGHRPGHAYAPSRDKWPLTISRCGAQGAQICLDILRNNVRRCIFRSSSHHCRQMRWWTFIAGVCLYIGPRADALEQDLLPTSFNSDVGAPSGTWDTKLSEDATGNLIFQSLASLLQLAPNSRYSNGIHCVAHCAVPP